MTEQGDATGRAALRVLWYRWTAVVELFARRQQARRRLCGPEYRALREDLLRVCRSLAGAAGEAGRGPYEALEDLVLPWLTPRTLEQADREVLLDLVGRCRRAGRDLGGPPWGYRARAWAGPGLALAAFAAGFAVLAWAGDRVWGPLRDQVDDGARALRWAVKQPGGIGYWVGGGFFVALIAMWLIARTTRS